MTDAPTLLPLTIYGVEVFAAGGALARHAEAFRREGKFHLGVLVR